MPPLADTRIRFHGVIDECAAGSCTICPDWQTLAKKRCYQLAAWHDDRNGVLMDELYRFTEVTITATVVRHAAHSVNEECFGNLRECLPDLYDPVVEELTARRPATEVALPPEDGPPTGPMLAVDKPTAAALRALFWQDPSVRAQTDLQDPAFYRFFVYRYDADLLDGYLCTVSRSDSAIATDHPDPVPPQWPAKSADFLRSPGNPYLCWRASKDPGKPWQLRPWPVR